MKKEKMILVPAAFLITAMLAFPVMASESINFLGGPARVASDRYEYEKALCVQV